MSNPTLIAENFSDSLGDFTGVDPIRYDSGLWLEEATTNLHPNPVANSATTNYLSSGATISRDTGTWVFGPASVKVVTNGSVQDERVRPHTNLLGYTGSARTFIGSVYTHVPLGATMRLQLLYLYSDATTDAVQTNFTGTGEWERIESPPLASNAAKTLNYMYAEVATRLTAQAITYYVNAVQIEEKGYATSFAHGGLGDGYAWVATADNSPSTRAASSAAISPAGILSPEKGSLAFRFRRKIDTGGVEPIIDCGDGTSGKDRLRVRINASDRLEMSWQTNGAAETTTQSVSTIAIDTEYLVYVGWNGIATELSIDNGTKVTGTRDTPAGSWGTAPLTLKAQ